jgi:hypothetical protein
MTLTPAFVLPTQDITQARRVCDLLAALDTALVAGDHPCDGDARAAESQYPLREQSNS